MLFRASRNLRRVHLLDLFCLARRRSSRIVLNCSEQKPPSIMINTSSDKTRGIRRHGPVTVAPDNEQDGPIKLYAFCKKSFPVLSKKVLSKCFLASSVFVNNEAISNGRDEESRKLAVGDVVEVQINMDAADALLVEATDLTVLHIQSGYAVLSKACGVSAAFDKELDKAMKARLWGGNRKKDCQLLYHLEKGFSGLCVVAETPEDLSRLRVLACAADGDTESFIGDRHYIDGSSDVLVAVDDNAGASFASSPSSPPTSPCPPTQSTSTPTLPATPSLSSLPTPSTPTPSPPSSGSYLEIIHRCIICGKIGEVGEVVYLETGHTMYQVIKAKVLKISRCRSKDFISLIDIRVTFHPENMGVEGSQGAEGGSVGLVGCSGNYGYNMAYPPGNIDGGGDGGVCGQEKSGVNNSNDNVDDSNNNNNNNNDDNIDINDDDNNNHNNDDDDNNENSDSDSDSEIEETYNFLPPSKIKQKTLTIQNIKTPKTAADFRFIHYPTTRLKTIKRALSLCGHTIVGDGGAVKSGKGIFAAVVRVTIFDDIYNKQEKSVFQEAKNIPQEAKNVPFTVSIDDPKKFQKLMLKEQELWELAEERDQVVISVWNKLNALRITDSKSEVVVEGGLTRSNNKNDIESTKNRNDNNNNNNNNSSNNYNDQHIKSLLSPFASLEQMRSALSSGMPVEYVLGESGFCGFKFLVDNSVMVPRKSSEVLVESAVEIMDGIIGGEIMRGEIIRVIRGVNGVDGDISIVCVIGDIKSINGNIDEDIPGNINDISSENNGGGKGWGKLGIKREGLRVLDMGTGSGCLLLSCLKRMQQQQQHQEIPIKPTHTTNNNEDNKNNKNNDDYVDYNDNRDSISITGVGIDISEEALTIARTNAKALELQDKTHFRILDFADLKSLIPAMIPATISDMDPHMIPDLVLVPTVNALQDPGSDSRICGLESIDSGPDLGPDPGSDSRSCGPFNIILCNPPYSSRRDRSRLSLACREHEPSLALFSPLGPLSAYRILAQSFSEAEDIYRRNKLNNNGRNNRNNLDHNNNDNDSKNNHNNDSDNNDNNNHNNRKRNDSVPQSNETNIPRFFAENAHVILEVGHGQDIPVQKIFSKLSFLEFVRGVKDHKGIDRCLIYKYCG